MQLNSITVITNKALLAEEGRTTSNAERILPQVVSRARRLAFLVTGVCHRVPAIIDSEPENQLST